MVELIELRNRVRRVLTEEGAWGVLRRILPFLWRMIRSLPARLGLRKAPPLVSLIAIVEGREDLALIVNQVNRGELPRPKRVFGELVILSYGDEVEEPELSAARMSVRWYHTPERDLAIVSNTAIALSRGAYAAFVPPENLRQWEGILRSPLLSDRGPLVTGLRDPILSLQPDRTPVPHFEAAQLAHLLIKRRAFLVTGMFQPERSAEFVRDFLERIWRGGGRFALLAEDEPIFAVGVMPEEWEEPPPRVIYFVNGTDVRGGIRIVFEHVNRLRDRGVEAFVASFEEPIQRWFPGLRAPLIRAGEAIPTDVAVATFFTTAPFVNDLSCARFYFIQHDEALFLEDEAWEREVRKTYRLPLEFITISSWLVDHIKQHSGGRDALLVPNGINRGMFYPDAAYPKSDRVRVLIEGKKEINWKGLDDAVEALKGLDVEVWSLGDTGVASDREFRYPPQDELRRIYSSCDILLKTSWYEGMPLPHMEAMACGCTLLTTNVAGVRDYCVDGFNCLLAEVRSPSDIRAKLIKLIEDPSLRHSLAANALQTSREGFGWDDKIDLLEQTYRKAAIEARAEFATPADGKDPENSPAHDD